MAKSRKKTISKREEKPKPAKVPRETCPFTGVRIEIRELAGGSLWQAVAPSRYGGWSTSLFSDKAELLWYLGWTEGARPGYPKRVEETITVRDRMPPPEMNEAATDAAKEQDIHDMSQEIMDQYIK